MKKLFFISLISLLFFACSKENPNNTAQKETTELQTKKTVEQTADLSVKNSDNNSLKETPEVQCKKAMDKFLGLMLEDPMMKNMPPEAINKMREQVIGKENIKKCVNEFKQETMDCIMKAETIADMQKCE